MTDRRTSTLHPSLQFLLFAVLCIAFVAIGTLIAAGIVSIVYGPNALLSVVQEFSPDKPNAINALWVLQIIGTSIPLLGIPLFFAFVVVKEPAAYLKPGIKFPWVLLLLVLLIMPMSLPTIEVLANINQKLVLPDFLKSIQEWMVESEKSAQALMTALLKMETIWDMVKNVLFIGLFTAVAEEFLFRGCLQTIFQRWTGNNHVAVWITGILFSAFHMQFFGFLPRVLLGVLFGYMVLYSGSIWPAVVGHFANNAMAVVGSYMYQHKTIKVNPDDQHIFNYTGYIISLIIVLFLLWVYRNIALSKKITFN